LLKQLVTKFCNGNETHINKQHTTPLLVLLVLLLLLLLLH
jgi:hypothetical protein